MEPTFRFGEDQNQHNTQAPAAPNPSYTATTANIVTLFNHILVALKNYYVVTQTEASIASFFELLFAVGRMLNTSMAMDLIEYASMASWFASVDAWVDMLVRVVTTFFANETRHDVRAKVIEVVGSLYEVCHGAEKQRFFHNIIIPVLQTSPQEHDILIFKMSLRLLTNVAHDLPLHHLDILLTLLSRCVGVRDSGAVNGTHVGGPEFSLEAVECVIDLFTSFFVNSAGNGCLPVFRALLYMVQCNSVQMEPRLLVWRFLNGLRADPSGRIRIPGEMVARAYVDSEEVSGRAVGSSGRDRESSAKWFANPMVVACDQMVHVENSYHPEFTFPSSPVMQGESRIVGGGDSGKVVVLPLGEYVTMITNLITVGPEKLDFVSSLCVEFPSQLENLHLFRDCPAQLQTLLVSVRRLIYNDRIQHIFLGAQEIKAKVRSDLYLMYFRILTPLLEVYNHIFSPPSNDILDTIDTFIHGMRIHTGVTARYCTQILTQTLFEHPQIMSKRLIQILDIMSRNTSTAAAATANLELLAALAHQPAALVNFTEQEYRIIFAVAVQYIRPDAVIKITAPVSTSTIAPSQPTDPALTTIALQNYVTQMAFHVLVLWFVQVRLPERRKYVGMILKLLGDKRDENVDLLLDMLVQNTYADCSPKPGPVTGLDANNLNAPGAVVASRNCRTWVQGLSLVTIRALDQVQWVEITVRRASGVVQFWTRLENRLRSGVRVAAMLDQTTAVLPAPVAMASEMSRDPKNQSRSTSLDESDVARLLVGSAADDAEIVGQPALPSRLRKFSVSIAADDFMADPTSQPNSIPSTRRNSLSFPTPLRTASVRGDEAPLYVDPSFVMLQLTPYPEHHTREMPYLLAEDDTTTRAISVLDRTPIVDLHKVGLVYVGPHQCHESDILGNTHGSRTYNMFLHSLGHHVRLKNCRHVNTGGLDTTDNLDGEFALYYWHDDFSQLIFHTTTLMPTSSVDAAQTAKKRHIGNNYVLVVWNESGNDVAFDTFPGQFNVAHVVITPMDADIAVLAGRWPSSTHTDDNNSSGEMSGDEVAELPQPVRFFPVDVFAPGTSVESATSGWTSDEPLVQNFATPSTADYYFRVTIQIARDVPELAMLTERVLVGNYFVDGSAVVGSKALAAFVRQVVVQCNKVAQIFMTTKSTGGKFSSNARERLAQIRRIRERRKVGTVVGIDEVLDFTGFT
ncbi:Tuberous sclerosis 2-like protein [Nowakowskiella sp. JEL0078]|nr:Tuberous sclerosis 2-like protein [Nowakowskiella sp. JEL0078]